MFYCKISEIFKNYFFKKTPSVTTSKACEKGS